MRGPIRSLALLSLLLIGLALPGWAAPAAPKVTLQAEAGFEGRAKSGQWIPVTLSITNEGPELTGSLEFESRMELGPNRQTATYRYPVVVPAGATKKVPLQMPPATGAIPQIRLMAGARLVGEVRPQVEITWDLLVGVLGVEPAEIPWLSGLKLGQRTVRLVRLTPDSLPAEPLVLQSLDLLLLDRLAWAELPAPQQRAVTAWVEHGGVLLAAGGPEVRRLEPLFPWLGLSLQGVERRSLEGLGPADLALFDPAGWRITRRSGPTILAAERSKGAGVIHFLAFDPTLEPFASWPEMPALMRDLLTRGVDLSTVQGGGQPMAQKTGTMLVDQLAQMPVKELPATRRLLWALGLYALLIGPVHLLLLRGFRRLGWALLTLPLLSMAGASSAWAYMQTNRGADVSAVSLGVIEGQPGGSTLMVRAITGFYLPPGAAHTATLGGGLLSPVPHPGLMTPGLPFKPADSKSLMPEGRAIELEPLEAWQMRAVAVEGMVAVSATVTGELVVEGQLVSGTVTNGLPYPLMDALLVVGPNFQRIGDLAPGQSAAVSVILTQTQPMGHMPNRVGEALGRSLEPGRIGPAGPSVDETERMRRQQLGWALSNSLPWSEGMEQPKVILVGWLESTGLPVSVDGHRLETTATALYVQRMDYAYTNGDFSLTPDFVQTRVINSSAGTNQPLHWGWAMAKGGAATLEMTVPAELVERITEMELRIPVMEKGPSTDMPYTLMLYRWADERWVEREFSLAAIPLLPADGLLSPDGRVRIQISKTSDVPGMLGSPGLSMRGKGVGR